MEFWITQVFNGISYGGLLFIFASGLSLVFGVMKIVNLAHGSYLLLAGYVAISMMWLTNNYFLGIIAGALVVTLLAIFMVKFFLRKVSENLLGQVLITTGFALIFQDAVLLIWGGRPYTIRVPQLFSGSLAVGHMYFSKPRIFILLIAVFIGIGLWLFQAKTKFGGFIRAAVDNEEMARGMGIDVPFVSIIVYTLGSVLAAIGGVVGGNFLGIYPGLDFEILPFAFVIVILGGRGSLEGAMVGSLLVGLTDTFGRVFLPEFAYFTLFAPMVLMLAIRPIGIFGKT